MAEYITNQILNLMSHHKELNDSDKDIYRYGVRLILSDLSNFMIILIPSLIFKKVIEGVIFITIFCLIRRYSGGYHCSTNAKCNFTYLIIYITLLVMLENTNLPYSTTVDILYYVCSMFIILLSPISRNRFFNESIARKNKTLTIIGVLITLFLNKVIVVEYSFIIRYVVIVVFLLMIIELIFRRRRNEFNY